MLCSFTFSAGGDGVRSFTFSEGGDGVRSFTFPVGVDGVRLFLLGDCRCSGTKGNSSIGSGVGQPSDSSSSRPSGV